MASTDPPTDASVTTPADTTDLQTKLTHLLASATQQYSLKNYSAAADFYSEAAGLQDEINGEMNPENADVLYQYGRCLYHVGVSKSDVLGGKVAGQGGEEPKKKKRKVKAEAESSAEGAAKGEVKDEGVKEESQETKAAATDRPFFQITGDENFTDSEEEGSEDDDDEAEEEDDDFALSYEILDLARVLLQRKLAALPDPAPETDSRALKERLADTHDLQAEIKLENEAFADAVADAREALNLKLSLYPPESGMRAEAHYKLAIALDFASLPTAPQETGEDGEATEKKDENAGKVDETLRAEAASQMSLAIESCTARLGAEETSLNALPASDTAKISATKASIADVKSLIAEMKARLQDLKNPVPAAVTADTGFGAAGGEEALKGLLGEMMGVGKGERGKIVEEATKGANDLSGMVRKGKRKADAGETKTESGQAEGEGKGKRAKTEEAEEQK